MNLSQINFGLFSLKLYGFFLGIAFALASWYWYKRIQKERLAAGFFVHHFWRWLLGGVLLGRLGALLADPSIFQQYGVFSFFAFWEGELHFHGFLIGALMVMYTDLAKHDKKPLKWIDLGVFPFLLAVIISDIVAFLTGAVYGTETGLFWGIQYEATGVKILSPVHPVTLYALIGHVGMWFAAKHYWKKWKKIPGKLATMAGIVYFMLDVVWQFFRADETLMVFGFRLEHWLSLLCAIALIYWYRRHYRS